MKTTLTHLLFFCAAVAHLHADSKPNIITILVDDMGFSDIGCYGGEIPTPNLDALAGGGLRYKQFYNNARCCPTRASLLTGVFPHQAGVGHMAGRGTEFPGYRGHLDERAMTLAQALQPNSYFTAMVGKWHVGNEPGSKPWERGFERSLSAVAGGFYFPSAAKADLFLNGEPAVSDGRQLPAQWYSSDLWTDFSLRFIDEAKAAKKPFYLYLAHNAPHFPLQAPAEDIAKFRGRYKAGWDRLREDRYAKQKFIGLIDSAWPLTPRPSQIQAWDSLSAEKQDSFDHLMAVYAACVSRMDMAVGDLVTGLKERGQFDNTLIFFMSDNGGNAESGPEGRMPGVPSDAASGWFCGESWAFLQNTPFRLYKHYMHEGGIASPLIVHWPAGIKAKGEWRNDPAQLIDVVATIADLTGTTFPIEFKGKPVLPLEGKSLAPTFTGAPIAGSPRTLYWEHEGNASVREGDTKLVRKDATGAWELYDLTLDRTEQNNLAEQQPEKVKALSELWETWAKRALVFPQPESAKAGEMKATKKGKRKASAGTFPLTPGSDLQGDDAPAIAKRAFSLNLQVKTSGTRGVLAAQGGTLHGWTVFVKNGQLNFVMNRHGKRETLQAPFTQAKTIQVSIGPKFLAKISLDGKEVAKRLFSGLLPVQPIDGLQIGRDLAAPVGDYASPFAFDGTITSASLEIGDEAPAPPFVGSVPSGGVVPKMDVKEQTKHPLAGRDKFGGFTGVKTTASGNFRVEQLKNRWFFITPEGHPFIALGPNHTGPTIRNQGGQNGLWKRWNDSADETAKNMLPIIQDLGFTAGDVYQPESTYTRTLPWISFFWYGDTNHSFIDVFDEPTMVDVTRRAFEHAKSVSENPWVLGIGGPDLSIWDDKLVRSYRSMKPDAPGRQRYTAFLRERYQSDIAKFNREYATAFASFDDLSAQEKLVYPADFEDDKLEPHTLRWRLPKPPTNPMQADNDAFCALIASTLFPQVRAAVKRGAPGHLFLGEHLAVRMIPDAVIAAMAPHIDAYLAQAVEVSPQRPPEWQMFQSDRWDAEYALLKKPIIIVDWGAVFSLSEPFEYRGYKVKDEREASDEAAKFITDAFERPYIIGLFLCKLWGEHKNDENFFQNKATRTYLKPDATPYPYRTEVLKRALHEAQTRTFAPLAP